MNRVKPREMVHHIKAEWLKRTKASGILCDHKTPMKEKGEI